MIDKDATIRVLVTGAAGFIGRHALPLLLANGFEVYAVDMAVPSESPEGLHWYQVDLLDAVQMDSLLSAIRPSHLLHFAWFT
ncbi:MAG: NAD-dependent epimerase/dehydratase family protein, partial [Deltaproteobacteria bacterium]|nr:NAD-dependent epimerase/dehydratase family protein [Deltaproteobacteria bacterium]